MRAGVVATLCLIFAWGPAAQAEPRLALREGMRCAHCHVNRTGGGMRTPFGATFEQTSLSTFALPSVFDPHLGSRVAYGANLRIASINTLAAQTELGEARWKQDATSSFEMREGNIYLRADLIEDWLTVYIDETVTPEGASSREAFVLIETPWAGLYLKGGRFMLPFGLRVPDDATMTRELTGFTYANQDLGFEVGIAPHPFSLSLAVTNGSLGGADPNLGKQITLSTDVVWSWGRAGASFAWNDSSTGDEKAQTFTTGAHLGVRLGRFIAFSEVDWLRGVTDAETYDQIMLLAALDYEVIKGLWLQFAFEAHDPLLSLDNNERDRFVFGVSWFAIPFLELRAYYRMNRDIPQRIGGNVDEVMFELHGFL